MKARYEQIVDPNKAVKKEFKKAYDQSGSKFDIALNTTSFVMFTDKTLRGQRANDIGTNWKAHISIHPDDLPRAWDLIHDKLYNGAQQFKVVDLNKLREIREQHYKTYMEADERRQIFTENYLKGALEAPELEHLAEGLFPTEIDSLRARKDTLSIDEYKRTLFQRIDEKYAADLLKMRPILAEDERLSEGMQISVYMLPGEEEDHEELFEEIEEILLKNNIRPGLAYPTDRRLGNYVSIRHPGLTYRDAVTAGSYNPDNQQDPFSNLPVKYVEDFETRVRQNIELLRSFKPHERMTETERHNTEVKHDLADCLEEKLNEFSRKSMHQKTQDIYQFQNDVYDAIEGMDSTLKNDSNAAFFKNIAMLVSGVGTLCALISLGNRFVTGRYLFFDDKESLFTPPKAPIYSSPDPGVGSSIASSESNHVDKFKEQVSAMKSDGKGVGLSDSESMREPLLRSSSFDISSHS
ncbi:hypothetical protein [Legionella sp. WA2022007384]